MRRRSVVLVVVGLVLALTTGIALGAALITTVSGRSITSVRAIQADPAEFYIAQANASNADRPWVNVTGAQTSMTIPKGQTAFFLVTISDDQSCIASAPGTPGSGAGAGCLLRVTVNGQPMAPSTVVTGNVNVAPSETVDDEERYSGQVSSATLPAGTYTIRLQATTNVGNNDISVQYLIRQYHLTVERVRV